MLTLFFHDTNSYNTHTTIYQNQKNLVQSSFEKNIHYIDESSKSDITVFWNNCVDSKLNKIKHILNSRQTWITQQTSRICLILLVNI